MGFTKIIKKLIGSIIVLLYTVGSTIALLPSRE